MCFPLLNYLLYSCLDVFMLLLILGLQNAESLSLYDVIILKLCYWMLGDALTTLVCYRSLQVNRFDLKGHLNLYFRKKLPVYNHRMLRPNCHTFWCRFLMMYIRRIVVHHASSVYLIEFRCSFLNKLNMFCHANSFTRLLCVCPRCLNRVSRRLKMIGEEEIGYHKPFLLNLKDIIDCKMKPFRILLCRSQYVCAYILCLTKLSALEF